MADRDIKHPTHAPNLAAHEVILEMAKSGAFSNGVYADSSKGEDLGSCIAAAHQKIADYYRTLQTN